jgi:hypothetical protein
MLRQFRSPEACRCSRLAPPACSSTAGDGAGYWLNDSIDSGRPGSWGGMKNFGWMVWLAVAWPPKRRDAFAAFQKEFENRYVYAGLGTTVSVADLKP